MVKFCVSHAGNASPKTGSFLQTETAIKQPAITDTSKCNFLQHTIKTNSPDYDTIQNQLSRKNKTIATYNVSASEIKVELFDNGEIDGDTETVYHNKQRIIDRKLLGIKPIVFTVKADAQNRVHEFILVANNLGLIPSNTALIRITAGTKIYELFASTPLQKMHRSSLYTAAIRSYRRLKLHHPPKSFFRFQIFIK